MFLYPCVVLGDYDADRVNTTKETAHLSKWSTTDETNIDPTIASTHLSHGSQRAMKIACTAPDNDWDGDADDDRIQKGISGTDFTSDVLVNPYGSTAADLSWATKLGCWFYSDDANYSAGNADAWQMYVTDDVTGTYVRVNWNLPATGRWYWNEGTPAVGTFAANATAVEVCGFGPDASGDVDSADIYAAGFVAFKHTETNDITSQYWKSGIELDGSRISWSGPNRLSVSGYIRSKYYRELSEKLHDMESYGAVSTESYRKVPHYQCLRDHVGIKPYLLYVEERDSLNLQPSNPQYVSLAMPVIVTNVETPYVPQRGNQLLQYRFDLERFGGLIL